MHSNIIFLLTSTRTSRAAMTQLFFLLRFLFPSPSNKSSLFLSCLIFPFLFPIFFLFLLLCRAVRGMGFVQHGWNVFFFFPFLRLFIHLSISQSFFSCFLTMWALSIPLLSPTEGGD
jgi:hypothetical protein